MELLDKFDALFGGRRDTYARGRPRENDPTKFEWPRVQQPLTKDILLLHMQGKLCVGIYPIVDDKVNWFAVDLDGPKDKVTKELLPNAYETAAETAFKQLLVFEQAGLHCYVERSRSGNGLHVWGFLDSWMPAEVVRGAIEPLLVVPAKQDGMDRLYPMQETTEGLGKGLGNLLALPFNGEAVKLGNSVFLDHQTREPINPRAFLAAVRLNKPAVIEQLYEDAPKDVLPKRSSALTRAVVVGAERRELIPTGALKMISPFGCKFMHHAWTNRRELGEEEWYTAIVQCTYFEQGRKLAHAISRDYVKYSAKETDAKFDHALGSSPGRTCAFIQERFPELGCTGCNHTAPYHVAKKSLIELASESPSTMEPLRKFTDDIGLVRAYNAGEKQPGIRWGIPTMDSMSLLRPSELTVFGGLPNMGKTWFLVDSAYSIAQAGGIPLVFSGETSRQPLRFRFLARASGIELSRLRGESVCKLSREEYARLEEAAAYLDSLPIFTDFTTLSPESVLAQTERTLLDNNIPLDAPYVTIFDYLQFGLREPGEESRDLVNRLAGEFKYVAKITEHPVLVLSQLRRGSDSADEPSMEMLAESSGIERNADVILIMDGQRASGPFATRRITAVKQREGEAMKQLPFVLHQGHGQFEPPRQAAPIESLVKDFGAGE